MQIYQHVFIIFYEQLNLSRLVVYKINVHIVNYKHVQIPKI